MSRSILLLAAVSATVVTAAFPDNATAEEKLCSIAIERSAGRRPPLNPLDHYRFFVMTDGEWRFKSANGLERRGKLDDVKLKKWMQSIRDSGFEKIESNPRLGQADEPYMNITVQLDGVLRFEERRIPLEAKLSRSIERRIVHVVSYKVK